MKKEPRHSALGIHVFAGGFTMGVREAGFRVPRQLEIHDFGRGTVETHLPGTEFTNALDWQDWPLAPSGCRSCFGNPRCTGFSCLSSGSDETVHGPDAHCTQDIWDLCQYSVREGLDLVVWESVQQAFTVGRKLLDRLRDGLFAPQGYRIAHVFINVAAMGSPQKRRRYFFVAYRDMAFNVSAPTLPSRQTWCGDILSRPDLQGRSVREQSLHGDYDADCCEPLDDDERHVVPRMPQGMSLNNLGRKMPHVLTSHLRGKWEERMSDMPFSLHCARRLHERRCCPTMSSSCKKFVHPREDRKLSVRELSALMGWPEGVTPVGESPAGQIAKGLCPEAGRWIAEQMLTSLDDGWGGEDWESRWDHKTGQWVGEDAVGKLEKVLHLTSWVPYDPAIEERAREDAEALRGATHEAMEAAHGASVQLG